MPGFSREQLRASTVAYNPPKLTVWRWKRLSVEERSNPAVSEGFALSAILYIDSQIQGSGRVLKTLFPDDSEPRYPALYLAEKFIQCIDISYTEALGIFEQDFSRSFPSTLVAKLACVAFDAVDNEPPKSTRVAAIQELAFKVLRLLTRCDRPELAVDIVVRTILDDQTQASGIVTCSIEGF
jgi:hypothetical protein